MTDLTSILVRDSGLSAPIQLALLVTHPHWTMADLCSKTDGQLMAIPGINPEEVAEIRAVEQQIRDNATDGAATLNMFVTLRRLQAENDELRRLEKHVLRVAKRWPQDAAERCATGHGAEGGHYWVSNAQARDITQALDRLNPHWRTR